MISTCVICHQSEKPNFCEKDTGILLVVEKVIAGTEPHRMCNNQLLLNAETPQSQIITLNDHLYSHKNADNVSKT